MTLALTVLVCIAALAAAVWLGARLVRPVPAGERTGGPARLLLAAGAGLALFFLLESGVCRRIGADLLLPVQGGAAMPWRALRMGLCLLLALAAGVWGGGAGKKLRALLLHDAGCWLTAAVVTALFFLWAWRVTVFSFMTNDDTAILRAIGSGSYWSLGSAYSHPLLCAPLHWLYQLAPDGSWYAWYHMAVIAAAMTVTGRCLLLKLRHSRWPAAGAAIQWLLGMGLFLYMLSELSFTVTAAAAGAAAAELILCRDETQSVLGRLAVDLGSAALALLCLLQRQNVWQALRCFWLLAAGYQLLRIALNKDRPRRLLRAGTLLVTAALVLAMPAAVDRVQEPASPAPTAAPVQTAAPEQPQQTEQPAPNYYEAERYRSRIMDYLLPNLTDEQLEAAGLPPELSTLLRGWFFMDQRINTDTFRTIYKMYANAEPTPAPAADAGNAVPSDAEAAPQGESGGALAQAVGQLRDMLIAGTSSELAPRIRIMALLACVMGLLAVMSLLRLIRYGLAGWLETLCALCAAGGGTLLLLYLLVKGRFLLRVFFAPALPAILFMALMLADMPPRPARAFPRRAAAFLAALLGMGAGALCLVTAGSVPYADQAITRQDVFGSQIAVEAYTRAQPEMTFITNMLSNDVDPFHAPSYPGNLHRWGGVGVTAKTNRLYADAFFRDDVRLLYQYPSTAVAVLQYLTLDYGPVQAQIDAQLSADIYVADLDQIAPGEDYTGWYEQNGLTYYFQNGQALTGEQVIDGQTYTFAPAGAASQFAAAPGPNGIIYFTNAYSLTDTQEQTP